MVFRPCCVIALYPRNHLPPASLSQGDDPGLYLEEMSQREAQYGPDHPRVAETCSNLAILYNQVC